MMFWRKKAYETTKKRRKQMQKTIKFMSSTGGGVVSIKRLGAVEALKAGEAVPLGKAGFMEAKGVPPDMIGDDVHSLGLLVLCCSCKQRRHDGSLQS